MRRWLSRAVLVALAVGAGFFGFRLLEARLTADVYRARLAALGERYAELAGRYDEAVRRTAVTELVVAGGRLEVHVRNAAGLERAIPTPFDPTAEIYVDYAVLDGRLWIRRVFDERTPPLDGVLVDPNLAHVDWNEAGARHGKATYRSLDEGRWIVTVSGNGALGLERAPERGLPELAPAPEVQDYAPVGEVIRTELSGLSPLEVVRQLFGS